MQTLAHIGHRLRQAGPADLASSCKEINVLIRLWLIDHILKSDIGMKPYLEAYGAAMLPSHRRAIADIVACRTEALGGQQWCCTECGTLLNVHHSCRNRSCPTCHGEQTRSWLEQRQAEMLPVPYFHVTVTVPEELRAVLRRHQAAGYGALMATVVNMNRRVGGWSRGIGDYRLNG